MVARRRWRALLVALAVPLAGPALASDYYPAFLVLRYFADDSKAARVRLEEDYRAYYRTRGREAASFRILDEAGRVIGRGSWMAFAAEDEAARFIADDPYARAQLYREVSVERADIYLLDEWFSIAPGWRDQEALREAHGRYDDQLEARPVPPR